MQILQNRIEIIRNDITILKVDAIVNAANSSLMGGGGVDGAIHRAGGPAILKQCRQIIERQGRCETGEAVITTGGLLPAKFVIHTVGPVWNGGRNNEDLKLANCYSNCLNIVVEKEIKTIAFPNISTGVYGYPKNLAAKVAIKTVSEFLETNSSVSKVYFVCFEQENFDIYNTLISRIKTDFTD